MSAVPRVIGSTVYSRNARQDDTLTSSRPWLDAGMALALALSVGYALLFGTLSVLHYVNFQMGDDITDYAQIVWNTANGHLLQLTHITTAGDGLRGGHVEPFLLLLAVPYRLVPDPRTLLVLQTIALAACGPLIYAMARGHGHRAAPSVLLTLMFFAFPHVQYANLHEFHPDPFGTLTLLGAMLAFDGRRWRLLTLCVVTTLCVKESMVPFVLGLGLYWWLGRREARVGGLTIAGALVYCLVVILPWYLATADQFAHDYGAFFGGAQGVTGGTGFAATSLAAHLHALGAVLTDSYRWHNIVLAMLPSGLLFVLDSSALVGLLPLALLFLGNAQINDIWFHHYVAFAPVVIYATSRTLRHPRLRHHAGSLAAALVGWSLLLGYMYAVQPICFMHWIYDPASIQASDHARAQATFIADFPDGASLDADPVLAAHLANRRYLYKLWDPIEAQFATYILLDLHADAPHPSAQLAMENAANDQTLDYMRRNGAYRLLRADRAHGLYLYVNCRRGSCGSRPDL